MSNQRFNLHSTYQPTGDQPQAIEKLHAGIDAGMEHQVLLGVTGSGKTFTMANVIEKVQKPTLIISHNKTLAAQLYQEFREFFPENSVNYFVSYYDYYQPEAYVPQRDLYIEKEAEINKEIEKLRHTATQALMTRQDVIVVASVSCIYGLGRPEDYAEGSFTFRSVKEAGQGPAATKEKERRLKPATTRKEKGKTTREEALQGLIRLLYKRNDWDFKRGYFRVRGDTIEVYPPYGEKVLRLEFLGENLSSLKWVEPETRNTIESLKEVTLYPAEHFITPEKRRERAIKQIEQELESHLRKLKNAGKDLEAHRLKQRTEYDLELMQELGFCPGIENYSRYLSGREEGTAPYTLLDYFGQNVNPRRHSGASLKGAAIESRPEGTLNGPEGSSSGKNSRLYRRDQNHSSRVTTLDNDWLCIIDESHMTIPQIRGMYRGDQARKETLVDYGFRLPSAKDNRPLRFTEFQERVPQTIYTSATPSEWEIERAQESCSCAPWGAKKERGLKSANLGKKEKGATSKIHNGVVEQLIRPTGLLDPEIEIRPTENQVKNLIHEIIKRKEKGERVLVTTLTKRMAEELADYLEDEEKLESLVETLHSTSLQIKACYLHSEIETLERSDILADLRRGKYDVVVGINLLREGLDLPEVSLVAILDADKEGFLRSDTSLIQTMGRAARHEEGKAILYADKVTGSMQRAIDEIERRREVQKKYNKEHDITPETIKKPIRERIIAKLKEDKKEKETPMWREMPPHELEDKIWEWEKEMRAAADELDFEKAAELRDKIRSAQSTL